MSLAPKIDELRVFLQHDKIDICCITETWLKDTIDDNVINIQNYQLLWKDRIHAQHGGVALYVKDNIKLDRLYEYEHAKCDHAAFPEVSQDYNSRSIIPSTILK